MKNRIPLVVLGALALVAIVWRIANPPPPTPPGPRGQFPTWKSRNAAGEMAGQAVNPSGTAWAGVWNEETRDGKLRSAVWIVDFPGYRARSCELKDGSFAPSLGWADDNTVRVLSVDSESPRLVTDSKIVYIDAQSAERDRTVTLKTDVSRILAWPARSDKFLAELADQDRGLALAVLSETGEVVGKEVVPDLPKDAELYTDAALSPKDDLFVFSVSDKTAKGGRAYYTADATSGAVKRAFDLKDVPGRIEGMWVSREGDPRASIPPAGTVEASVLMVCSARDNYMAADYSWLARKITTLKSGVGEVDLAKLWPGAPKRMMFVTYDAGYSFDLTTGKTKKLFDLTDLTGREQKRWRQQITGGRLYPLSDGCISVSMSAGAIDIRQLDKKGVLVRDLLARQ